MLDQNIIVPSQSPWSAPIWVVPKKLDASGERKWRVVIDYRKLTDVTIGEVYPIPQITEILDQLGKCKYFSTLDLASGFHQIKVSPEDSSKTAFSTPQGHFQFNRMPFGLKNSPSTFQKLMNTCLSGLQGDRCFVYLDDIVIYSYDLGKHIENLEAVFERLRKFSLKLQPDKCEFLCREVGYLGHIISEDGVRPNPDKTNSVSNYPIPQNHKDIRSFLGLVSYYRRFIPDFAKIAKPLTNLLKKDVSFAWNNEQQLAFDTLKKSLVSAPVLAYPDFTKPFILTCDASDYAISAILSQGTVGKDRPIAYASRTLNKAEKNYSVTEKECLAILFGTKNFHPYLYGNRFKIVTDHRPLVWLFNCKDPGSRLVRWRLKLEQYDYEIEYKKGKINSNADALSRYPVCPVDVSQNVLPPIPENQLDDFSNDLLSPIPFTYDENDLLDLNPNPTLQPVQNPDKLPSPISDLVELGPLDLSPHSSNLNLDFENLDVPATPETTPLEVPITPETTSSDIPVSAECDPLTNLNLNDDDYSKL